MKNINIPANNPALKTWLDVPANSDFPIQNIPFGVFSVEEDELIIGSRIGNYAISLPALNDLGFFNDIDFDDNVLYDETLNAFISEGKPVWTAVRNRISQIFEASNPKLRDDAKAREAVI